jgi:DNA repair exonuclease SbcCD nuclease subunit
MKNSITFIHAADLHLDSPFVGLKHLPSRLFEKIRESTFLAFSRLITFAIKEQVDFVLLAGDLYDEEERSLKAQLKLKKEFDRLYEAGIEVFVIHGNHDHMGGKWLDIQWPENVHVFSSKQVEMKVFRKNGLPLAYIYGYSYPTRSVIENMSSHYMKNDNTSVYHIGMLHGSIEGNNEHDVYCPFKLNELITKEFDYWALGHIHKRQLLHKSNPIIAYPGNIQGRHRKELGEKGFYLVEMNEDDATTSFISTEEVLWEEVKISINGINSISELMKQCEEMIEQVRLKQCSTCLTIVLTGTGIMADSIQSSETIQDLMDALNETEGENEHFVWIVKIENHTFQPVEEKHKLASFFTDLHTTVESYQLFETVIEPLTQHPIYRKYITEFTKEEQKQLLKEAEQLLHKELLQQNNSK